MINYAESWKKYVNFHQYSYKDFISEFSNISNTYFIEKFDGMLGALIFDHKQEPFFQTTFEGRIEGDIPVLYEYKILLKSLGIKNAVIIGELIAIKNGKILPFNEIVSVVKMNREPQNKPLIYHAIYDIWEIDKKNYKGNFNESVKFLNSLKFRKRKNIIIPKFGKGDINSFIDLYNRTYETSGFDGVVARDIKGRNYKIKFTNTLDLLVIGAGNTEMKNWPKGQISYLITSFLDKDGLYRTSSKIGTGFDETIRTNLFNSIQKNKLYEKNGNLYVPPKREFIIEVKFFRYRITETPTYKYQNGIYNFVGNKDSITLSHPVFVRFRPDKNINKNDLRLEQIPEFNYV